MPSMLGLFETKNNFTAKNLMCVRWAHILEWAKKARAT